MAKSTHVFQFNTGTWDEIEKVAGARIDSDRGWYLLKPKGQPEPARFLYGDWLVFRDGLVEASEHKPKGV